MLQIEAVKNAELKPFFMECLMAGEKFCPAAGTVVGLVAAGTGAGAVVAIPLQLATITGCKLAADKLASSGVSTDGNHIATGTNQSPVRAGTVVAQTEVTR